MPKDHREVPCHEESLRTDVTGLLAQKLAATLTLDEARAFLAKCARDELNDHAFGDSEVGWFLDGKKVANGYFSATSHSIGICHGCQGLEHTRHTSFKDADALALRYSGVLGRAQRNDSSR